MKLKLCYSDNYSSLNYNNKKKKKVSNNVSSTEISKDCPTVFVMMFACFPPTLFCVEESTIREKLPTEHSCCHKGDSFLLTDLKVNMCRYPCRKQNRVYTRNSLSTLTRTRMFLHDCVPIISEDTHTHRSTLSSRLDLSTQTSSSAAPLVQHVCAWCGVSVAAVCVCGFLPRVRTSFWLPHHHLCLQLSAWLCLNNTDTCLKC